MALFDYVIDFWDFWLGTNFNDPTTVQLLAVVSTISLVYGIIIYPIQKIFKGRRR